jgi:hypothetical protein
MTAERPPSPLRVFGLLVLASCSAQTPQKAEGVRLVESAIRHSRLDRAVWVGHSALVVTRDSVEYRVTDEIVRIAVRKNDRESKSVSIAKEHEAIVRSQLSDSLGVEASADDEGLAIYSKREGVLTLWDARSRRAATTRIPRLRRAPFRVSDGVPSHAILAALESHNGLVTLAYENQEANDVLYLVRIDWPRRSVCVDVPIGIESRAGQRIVLSGDTVFVERSDHAQTSGAIVDWDRCDWAAINLRFRADSAVFE